MSLFMNFFPVLDDEMFQKIGFESDPFEFTYQMDNGQTGKLEAAPPDGDFGRPDVLCISDDDNLWYPDSHGLNIFRDIHLNNPGFLFGAGGLAGNDATIGIGVRWWSKPSSVRGALPVAEFQKTVPGPLTCSFRHSIAPGFLRGHVVLQTVLYLQDPGNREPEEQHLSGLAGSILGVLDRTTVHIDGSGSVFPIVEVENPSQPLWWVVCDWSDPMTDLFNTEFVRICINRAHSGFQELNYDAGGPMSRTFQEIIASGLQIIIENLRNSVYWDDILKGKETDEGSIASVVHYFSDTHGWDMTSPERLAISIRNYLDRVV